MNKIKSVYDLDRTLVGAIYKPEVDQFMIDFDETSIGETFLFAGQISQIMKDLQQTITDETMQFLKQRGYRPKDSSLYVKGLKYRLKKKGLELKANVTPGIKHVDDNVSIEVHFQLHIKETEAKKQENDYVMDGIDYAYRTFEENEEAAVYDE